MQVKTIEQAIDLSYPQLSKIKKDAGEVVVKTVLVEALSDLVMFFNVGKTMNAPQIVQTVELVLEQYWYLRLSEFKYCFTQAMTGAYGKVYDRIDGAIIFEWIEKYLEERMGEIVEKQTQQHEENKKDVSILSALHEKGISFKPKTVEETKIEQKKTVEKSEREKLIQKFFREFDELHKTEEVESKGSRLINYKGKVHDSISFIETKLKEHDNEISG